MQPQVVAAVPASEKSEDQLMAPADPPLQQESVAVPALLAQSASQSDSAISSAAFGDAIRYQTMRLQLIDKRREAARKHRDVLRVQLSAAETDCTELDLQHGATLGVIAQYRALSSNSSSR